MTDNVVTNWVGSMAFESAVDEYKVRFDADEQFGGMHQGPKPKPVLLGALAGCTGMDVISILKKKQIFPDSFSLSVSGELTEEHPKYYHRIHIVYQLKGPGYLGNQEIMTKAARAVQLSLENYCGVSAMLKKSCELTSEIILLDS
jgi:putative redox protein